VNKSRDKKKKRNRSESLEDTTKGIEEQKPSDTKERRIAAKMDGYGGNSDEMEQENEIISSGWDIIIIYIDKVYIDKIK
jgi:hypothetical protein